MRTRGLRRLLALAGLALLAVSVADAQNGGGLIKAAARVPQPTIVIAHPGKCVAPTEVMRKDHMQFLLHHRDETMHEGIRTKQFSLKNCVDCHADPVTHTVLGKNGFCQSCHTYAAVSIDCFSCHSPNPEQTAKGAPPSPSAAMGTHLETVAASAVHIGTAAAPLPRAAAGGAP